MYLRVVIIDLQHFFSLRETLPVVDVRSEGEYEQGHVEGARNIPLLNNQERVKVGTLYKERGQREAILEGFRLVGPRLISIVEEAERVGGEMIVHCWRGGMRSNNFCQFASMAGLKTHQLKGGYKSYRQLALESFKWKLPLIVLSGLTGSGKTEILKALKAAGQQVLDLEGLANHKGSVFGGLNMPAQPTTEQFQNNLFEALRVLNPYEPVWVEDESIAIGKIFLPNDFWNSLRAAPIIEVEVPKEIRLQRLVQEYSNVPADDFHECMKGITKKLGGQHYNAACAKLYAGDLSGAIELILTYYDKAYSNGMERKKERTKLQLPWHGSDVKGFSRELVDASKNIGINNKASIAGV